MKWITFLFFIGLSINGFSQSTMKVTDKPQSKKIEESKLSPAQRAKLNQMRAAAIEKRKKESLAKQSHIKQEKELTPAGKAPLHEH